jgi:hypothetical protein
MNTQISTDLPEEVNEQLQTLFDAAKGTIKQREEDAFVYEMKAEEERIAKLQAEWAEPLQVLTSRLPEWIHKYIQAPTTEYSWWNDGRNEMVYNFVTIEVPGCHPIAAWVECKKNNMRLEVMSPELYRDDEDGLWTVVSKPSHYRMDWYEIKNDGEDDVAVALFRAHDTYLQYLELAAVAEQRNAREAEKAAAPISPPAPAIPADPIDQARQLVAMMTNNKTIKHVRSADMAIEDNADERTLVLASVGLAIAYHVSRVADALESKGI